ncbi:MAG: hypothetical protein J6I85_00100 [Clostridia bacterium]|nr:hypothetical protein [Clostridia bacterium]
MDTKFNNYSLTNDEIIKIIKEYEGLIKYASRQVGEYSEECEQQIKVALFIKLAKNRK